MRSGLYKAYDHPWVQSGAGGESRPWRWGDLVEIHMHTANRHRGLNHGSLGRLGYLNTPMESDGGAEAQSQGSRADDFTTAWRL